MQNNITLIGLYMGLITGVFYLVYFFIKYKAKPQFTSLAIIIMSCVGLVTGFHLGFIALTIPDKALGSLSDQRVAISLGAVAVVWVSFESLYDTWIKEG
jgi:hypothetical protein